MSSLPKSLRSSLSFSPFSFLQKGLASSLSYAATPMVYITSWDEFVDRSVQLFCADPDSTCYCMKYRHCDGKLILKVTDNKEVGLFLELNHAQDAKKMEKLNNIFFTLMSRAQM